MATGKTNAGGGGALLTSNDAILQVNVPNGSTVTISRGSITKRGVGIASGTTGTTVFFFTIKASEFSSTAWTISASSGGSAVTQNVVINAARVYTVSISYRLPTAYQEVTYLESSGGQWVNTGYQAANTGRMIITGRITAASQYTCLFGAVNSYSAIENVQSLAYRPADGFFFLDNNGYMTARSIGANTDFTVDFTVSSSSLSVTVNGTTNSISGTVGTITTNSIWLFACSYGGRHLQGVNARIKECKMYNRGGTLVADMIPCYRRSDNVAGFYDIVRNNFYVNGGSGTLAVGADV